MSTPDYKIIFIDIIKDTFPEKLDDKYVIERLNNLNNSLDVIEFNNYLFPNTCKNTAKKNQQMKSFDIKSIEKILEYQKKNNLTNSDLANKFRISRNTVRKWKKYL